MKRTLFFGLLLIVSVETGLFAQSQDTSEPDQATMQQLLKEALSVFIQAKLVQSTENIMWQSEVEKLTIPGRAVSINMQNEQARLLVRFTPYRKVEGGLILVAQSEIWLHEPGEGDQKENLRYFTSMRSIPLDYDEIIYFYPLGKIENLDNPDHIHIEMALRISPYDISGETVSAEAASDGENKGN
ncbi:MAG: hypothetical protein PQJ58_22075 [Spirochaetales bacterium]|nr:hypothetical protein [Spirochaetales bacterium]